MEVEILPGKLSVVLYEKEKILIKNGDFINLCAEIFIRVAYLLRNNFRTLRIRCR